MNKEIEQRIHEFAEKMYQAGYQAGYEEHQKQADAEIRVGDEVIVNGNRAIVIKVDIDYRYRVVYENGNTNYIHQDTIMDKTGKHYSQIEEVLKELAGGENNADSN